MDKTNLKKENLFLQKKLSEIEQLQDHENIKDYKKKVAEVEKFIELFIYFVQKYNFDKFKNNYTNEGYNMFEVNLLQLESYIQDLKIDNKNLTENSNQRNEISQRLLFDLKKENSGLK